MNPRHSFAYVLNVMADDRPGIVSAVSKAVVEAGGNIDACSQTVLEGYFTLIMVISFLQELHTGPFLDSLSRRDGSAASQDAAPGGLGGADFQVQIRAFKPTAGAAMANADNFVVTCFGPDVEGVIYRFSALLAEKGINIVDLYGQSNAGQFMLVSQVQIPRHWDLAMLQADLENLGRLQGYTVRLQHENIFIATNQLRLGRR